MISLVRRFGSSGPTGIFQARVSGTDNATNHLSAGEQFTPHPHQADPNHEAACDRSGDRIAPLTMDGIVIRVVQAHKAYPGDVHRDH
jgi:hypothetical protein